MRKLHLVGFTSDRKGLIYSARRGSKSGGFLVPIEDSLVARIEEATRGPNGDDRAAPPEIATPATGAPGRPRSQSALTPREMQARLRAGRTIAEVAAEAKADPEWVERFAIPILAEQAQMVELARSLTYVKPRRGESAEPLGPSVAENLAERGVQLIDDQFDAAWSAYQLHDVVWVVRVRYRSRGRLQEAAWEVDVATGQLSSRNRLASDLGYVEKGRRRRSAPQLDAPATAEVPAEAVITRRASVSGGKAQTDGGARRKASASSPAARRPPARRAAKAKKTGRATAARAGSTAKARPATAKVKAAGKRVPAKARSAAKVRSASAAKRPAARTRSSGTAKRPPSSARPAKATKRAATRSGGARPPARKGAVAGKPPGPEGPAPGHAASLTPTGNGNVAHDDGPSAPDRPRLPINRLAANRVAASRAAAARLADDRRASNPVPPPEPDARAPHRPGPLHRSSPSESPPRPGSPLRPAPARPSSQVREPEPSLRSHKPSVADLVFEDLYGPDEPPERPWATDEVTTGERPVISAERVAADGARAPDDRSGSDSGEVGTASPWPTHAR